MAALAYVLLPLSGLVAFLAASEVRVRWHGLQAIAFGTLWAAALFGGSALAPAVTRAVFVLGALVWLLLLGGSALGRDPALPLVGARLRRVAITLERPTDPDP